MNVPIDSGSGGQCKRGFPQDKADRFCGPIISLYQQIKYYLPKSREASFCRYANKTVSLVSAELREPSVLVPITRDKSSFTLSQQKQGR